MYHSLGCGDCVVAVECFDSFVVTHTDDSQFSEDAVQLSQVGFGSLILCDDLKELIQELSSEVVALGLRTRLSV